MNFNGTIIEFNNIFQVANSNIVAFNGGNRIGIQYCELVTYIHRDSKILVALDDVEWLRDVIEQIRDYKQHIKYVTHGGFEYYITDGEVHFVEYGNILYIVTPKYIFEVKNGR